MPRFWRKIIQITAHDSPNVILGLWEEEQGLTPSNREIIPGVLSFAEFRKRDAIWDEIRKTIGLWAEFYKGPELKMFPQLWVNRGCAFARKHALLGTKRKAKALGVDPGEGSSDTSWAVVDEYGLISLESMLTPDTDIIPRHTLALMHRWQVPGEYVGFDRGGGGKQCADRLRAMGHRVRTIAFGEPLLLPIKYGDTQVKQRMENREERYTYLNRRAQMYGTLRNLLDPAMNPKGFTIPAQYVRLRRELKPIPLTYDAEGRLYLLPKNKKDPNSKEKTLIELIGWSPNDSDSLVVAVHTMLNKPLLAKAGVN